MTLDRLALAAYFREIEPRVLGRRIEKVRPHGRAALKLELSSRDVMFVDVSRSIAGFWLLGRNGGVPADARDVVGPSRTAALLFKKHLEGMRIEGLEGSPERLLSLTTSRAAVLLRAHGAPGASLVIGDEVVAHFGAGENILSIPADVDAPTGLDGPEALAFVEDITRAPREDRRSLLLKLDPGLQPLLRRWPVSVAARTRLADVLAGVDSPSPYLSPPPGDDAANALTPPALLPFESDGPLLLRGGFSEAAGELYVLLRRADLFREATQASLARARLEVARLSRLKAALERDRGRWPDPAQLRVQAEALLSAPPGSFDLSSVGRSERSRDVATLLVPDPRTGNTLEARINPRLSLPQNANALYARARNIERQQAAFEERWEAVESRLQEAERVLAEAVEVRALDESRGSAKDATQGGAPAPRRYLTSRGLELLFGRSAAENHDVTFKLARREDIWFHVLDAPGGHVVLRNREGRANREDIAEAAALAAFLSERRTEGHVDVQYTERKHVQPSGGGKGRVRVTHAEVIRVTPQDPAGRLRGRS